MLHQQQFAVGLDWGDQRPFRPLTDLRPAEDRILRVGTETRSIARMGTENPMTRRPM